MSVLKLSNGYVEGYILPWIEGTDIAINSMECNEFIDFLKLKLKE